MYSSRPAAAARSLGAASIMSRSEEGLRIGRSVAWCPGIALAARTSGIRASLARFLAAWPGSPQAEGRGMCRVQAAQRDSEAIELHGHTRRPREKGCGIAHRAWRLLGDPPSRVRALLTSDVRLHRRKVGSGGCSGCILESLVYLACSPRESGSARGAGSLRAGSLRIGHSAWEMKSCLEWLMVYVYNKQHS